MPRRRQKKPVPAKKADKPALNARQSAFVRHYTAGADGVRGNATKSYVAAGYSTNGADVAGPRLAALPHIKAAIDEVHAKADRAAARRLRDWKALAPDAQARLQTLSRGRIPQEDDPERGLEMYDRDSAAVGSVVMGAIKEILERAQPKKLQLDVDPRSALAQLLGVTAEALPDDEEAEANG